MNYNYKVYNLNPADGKFFDYFSVKLFKGKNKAVYRRIVDGTKQVDVRYIKGKRKFALVTDLNTGKQKVLFRKDKYSRFLGWYMNFTKDVQKLLPDFKVIENKSVTRNGKKIKGRKYIEYNNLHLKNDTFAEGFTYGFYNEFCGKTGKFGEFLNSIEKAVKEYRLNPPNNS